ncbi:DUF2321 domain-containing protein [Bifidobacterium vansinderenii]|uniref:Uncharacterized protein n=1 Tax=Bifidobacterium vansinderenii TaxID=1984871 RepID=A0A229VWX4_9BIFI|nr:DUF2321 domain-containing protein [Bifidobacterium vansinderenii]OXM99909.1 hypothetical protein Tam10B_1872 [Bifidobacterium vansinderenii]
MADKPKSPWTLLSVNPHVNLTVSEIESGLSFDTRLTVRVRLNSDYPDSVLACMLWMAGRYVFNGMEELDTFRDDFEDHPSERWQRIIDQWPLVFGPTETALKKLFAPMKPVVKRPPWSKCQRCGAAIFGCVEGMTDIEEIKRLLKNTPAPYWCRSCGQRFKFTGKSLSCTDEFTVEETLESIEHAFPTQQPSFDTLQIEAGEDHDD